MIDITDSQQFQNYLQQYRIVVLDVWADWCSPCKYLAPIFEKFATEYSSSTTLFCKCDIESNTFTDVQGLPTIRFYVNGKLQKQIMGADVNEIETSLKQICGSQQQVEPATTAVASHHQDSGTGSYQPKRHNTGDGYKSFGSY